jgi:two-component system sensor histidine kinase BaeS
MNFGIPLRKRLLVRLLIASVLIAVCSVAATAWLAVETTTRALREEQGQVLADDMDILARLSGYAATHPEWRGVEETVRSLSARTGRRVALTTPDRRTIADSAPPGTSLPPRAAATVDPLRTDTYTDRGAQRSGIDPRVVGPYLLPVGERARLDKLAVVRQQCFARNGYEKTIVQTPSGRPVLTDADGAVGGDYVPDECADGKLNTATPTEEKALADLMERSRACLEKRGLRTGPGLFVGVDVTEQPISTRYLMGKVAEPGDDEALREAEGCAADARRAQLDPHVAPLAHLFLGGGDPTAVRFDMSPANKANRAWCSPSPSP